MQERKDHNLSRFIRKNEPVREYLHLINKSSNIEEIRMAIKEIMKSEGIKKLSELVSYCKKTSSDIRYVRKRKAERSKLHRRLIIDDKFASLFIKRGLLAEDDLLLNLTYIQLEKCLCLIDSLMDVGWEISITDPCEVIEAALLDL